MVNEVEVVVLEEVVLEDLSSLVVLLVDEVRDTVWDTVWGIVRDTVWVTVTGTVTDTVTDTVAWLAPAVIATFLTAVARRLTDIPTSEQAAST